MSSAAAMLQVLPGPSTTAGAVVAAPSDGAASLFGDLVAQALAPQATEEAATADTGARDAAGEAGIAPGDSSAVPADMTAALVQAGLLPPAVATPAAMAEAEAAPASTDLPSTDPSSIDLLGTKAAPPDLRSSDLSRPDSPSLTGASGKPVEQAQAASSPKAGDADVVKTDLAALTRDPVEATRPAAPPATDTPRPAFSLQAVTEATATPYTPPPAVAANASAVASGLSSAAVDQLNQLSVTIQKRLSQGTTKFQLELKPADLGRVDVALTITAAGAVTAHLEFDTPITATTFAARESELRQHLAAAGLKLDGDALTFSSRPADSATTAPASQQAAAFTAFGDQASGQQARSNARQAAKTLQQAQQAAAEAELDAALAQLRHHPGATRLALDLTV